MSKFTKVTLMIAAVLAGLGILFCGIASILGLRYGTIRGMARNGEFSIGGWDFGEGYYYTDDNWGNDDYYERDDWDDNSIVSTESMGSVTSTTKSFPVESIRNLEIRIGAAALNLIESTDVSVITVSLDRGYERYFEYGMDGDTLEVRYDKKDYTIVDRKSEITVYIPSGMSFTNIDLDIGATDAIFDVGAITCEDLKINVGAGGLEASGLTVTGQTDVTIGAGAVALDESAFADVRLECGVGELSMGGTVSGDITAHSGMGSMELDLLGRETDYNYDLSCGMGELVVNGTSYSNISGSRKVNNDGAIGTISLDCGMGSIDLEIEAMD